MAPRSSSCDPCHGSEDVPGVRLRLQGEVRIAYSVLAGEGLGEECSKEVLDPYPGTLLAGHAACCLAARWVSMAFSQVVAGWAVVSRDLDGAVDWHRPGFAARLQHSVDSALVGW